MRRRRCHRRTFSFRRHLHPSATPLLWTHSQLSASAQNFFDLLSMESEEIARVVKVKAEPVARLNPDLIRVHSAFKLH